MCPRGRGRGTVSGTSLDEWCSLALAQRLSGLPSLTTHRFCPRLVDRTLILSSLSPLTPSPPALQALTANNGKLNFINCFLLALKEFRIPSTPNYLQFICQQREGVGVYGRVEREMRLYYTGCSRGVEESLLLTHVMMTAKVGIESGVCGETRNQGSCLLEATRQMTLRIWHCP